jgi:catechol 2,3-dioxygenase-like lactoylglutathione lyase family enzyme
MITVDGMNHFTILAEDLDATRAFYTEVLGLTEGYRPPFRFPGIWFYAGDRPILHIIHKSPLPDPKGGVFDHMAFSATDLKRSLAELDRRGIEYELVRQVGSGIWQVFFFDPNGAKVELDFDPAETAP